VQSRLLHRNLLVLVDLARFSHVQHRADLSPRNHVVIIRPARSWPGRLARGVLHQLSHFFFQCHPLQNRIHSRVETGIRDAVRLARWSSRGLPWRLQT